MCPRWQAPGVPPVVDLMVSPMPAVLDIVYIRLSGLIRGDDAMRIGYFLSSEEFDPKDLVAQAWCARHPTAPPIYVSGFGPRSARLVARIGDGYCLVAPRPEMVERFRTAGGGDKPVQAGLKVCYGADARAALPTDHRIWPNEQLPGELAQGLPTPEHFEQASSLVTPETGGRDRALRTRPRRPPRGYPALRQRRCRRALGVGARPLWTRSRPGSPHQSRGPNRPESAERPGCRAALSRIAVTPLDPYHSSDDIKCNARSPGVRVTLRKASLPQCGRFATVSRHVCRSSPC